MSVATTNRIITKCMNDFFELYDKNVFNKNKTFRIHIIHPIHTNMQKKNHGISNNIC